MEFFILVAISIIFGRYALKVFNARRHFTLPSTLKIEKISEDFGNEAITKAQRLEIEDLLEIAEANGFVFDYWQRLTSDRPVINLVTAVLRSADNTICLQVAVENQGNPASIEMNTDFSDGAQIITLSPFGETVDDSDYQFSFAFDAQIAIDHHHKQIEKMSFLHGNPIVFENFEDDLASDECYRTHFRDRTWMQRKKVYKQVFIVYSAAAISMLLVLFSPLLLMSLLISGRIVYPSNYNNITYLIALAIGIAAWIYPHWRNRQMMKFSDAIDAGINLPPVFGKQKAKRKEPTGTHPLEEDED